MNNQFGDRTLRACELLETLGPMNYGRMAALLDLPQRTKAWQMMDRATSYGLMTVDKTTSPMLFSVADDWRKVAAKRIERIEKPKPTIKVPARMLNSVWSLAE